jgi:hypothetical protein
VSSDRWTLAEERDVRSLVVPKVGSFERLDDPLEVDEIGPSLRYATAKVNKVSRDSDRYALLMRERERVDEASRVLAPL